MNKETYKQGKEIFQRWWDAYELQEIDQTEMVYWLNFESPNQAVYIVAIRLLQLRIGFFSDRKDKMTMRAFANCGESNYEQL